MYADASPKVLRPVSLREALGGAFAYRGRFTWRAPADGLLGLRYPGTPGAAVVLDVADVPDFHDVRSDERGCRIGAFAPAERVVCDPVAAAVLGNGRLEPSLTRFRLAVLDAELVVAVAGATRTMALADAIGPRPRRPLGPGEIPLAAEVRRDGARIGFSDRRINRRDGRASFDLRVCVALRLSELHRIATAIVAYSVDGEDLVAIDPVDALLRDARIARTTFGEAARRAADAFRSDDERGNALRRTIVPLALSTLKESYAHARAAS